MPLDLEFQELAKHVTKFNGGLTSPPCFFVVVNLGVILWQIKPFLHDLQKKLSFKRNEQKLPYTIFFTFDFHA